jgi:hypothetical protein
MRKTIQTVIKTAAAVCFMLILCVANAGYVAKAADTLSSLYPFSVEESTNFDGTRQITKMYELGSKDDPKLIPQTAFERDGYLYTITDITRSETAIADEKTITQTAELPTETKELAEILPLLAATIVYSGDDGYVGILTLDTSTIKVEVANSQNQAYTKSISRSYPSLSSNDTALLPKTVTEGGKTYTLTSVDWKAGDVVDSTGEARYYSATASYTTSGTYTRVLGYRTTADYTGEVVKYSKGKTLYTAFFTGVVIAPETDADGAVLPTEINVDIDKVTIGQLDDNRTPALPPTAAVVTPELETVPPIAVTEPDSETAKSSSLYAVLMIFICAGLTLAVLVIFKIIKFPKKKGTYQNENNETEED